MANPETIDGELAVLVAGTTQDEVALNPQREYTLQHDGEDGQATPEASMDTIYLAVDADVDADGSEGLNKYKLRVGGNVVVGPNVSVLKFKTASGAPTFSVSPSRHLMGEF